MKWGVLINIYLWSVVFVFGQQKTIGLLNNQVDDQGFVLFTPLSNKNTYLIDRDGALVHQWQSDFVPGMTVYLREDGTLFRAGRVTDDTYINSGGAGGIIEQFNWDGEVIWQYRYSSPQFRQHHDFELLPNGNILILAWEKKTIDEAIAAGRDPASLGTDQLWPDHLVEVKPQGFDGGDIVWEWHIWDHLVQDFDAQKDYYGDVSNPELININHYQNSLADWIHGNAIEYNAHLDQIMLSTRGFNELWIIDHSTSCEEAKTDQGGNSGKGGNLLWRWGNPIAYQGSTSQSLYGQHGIYWDWSDLSQSSRVYVFNNGNGRKPNIFSTLESIEINYTGSGVYPTLTDGTFAPADFAQTFNPTDSLLIYAPLFSNVIRLENDHLLTCVGPRGTFIEFDKQGVEVWKYINPVTESGRVLRQGESIGDHQASLNSVFSIQYYPGDYTGFENKDLSAKGTIEEEQVTSSFENEFSFKVYPNPASDYLQLDGRITGLKIFDLKGRLVLRHLNPASTVDIGFLEPGIYWCQINDAFSLKLILLQ